MFRVLGEEVSGEGGHSVYVANTAPSEHPLPGFRFEGLGILNPKP